MPNMYVLATGSLASPWTRESTWDGRYLRCASSSGTGGASQHLHSSIETTSGSSGATRRDVDYTVAMGVHSHTIPSFNTGYSNNDPLYYTLSLWKMDAGAWEISQRCFPANAVVMSIATLTAANFSRLSAPDGKLIKLGDPASSGGRSTHTDHSVDATLAATTPGAVAATGCCSGPLNANHSHTFTAASVPSGSIMPAHVQTRLYYTTAKTDEAPAGVVCLFDGTPSASWTIVSWTDKFLMSNDCDPTNDGSDTHGHTSVSGSSSTYYNLSSQAGLSSTTLCPATHGHSVAVEFNDATAVPLYVALIPYRLTVTLEPRPSSRPLMW